MPDTSVTTATIEDLAELTRLFDAYRVFYGQESDPSRAERFLRDRLQYEDSVIFIARHTDAAAGFVQMYPSFSSVSTAVIWILNDLYVDRGNRRLGIAKALLEFAAEWAQTNGSARLVLETARDNTPAKSLYENLGWKLDEEFDRYTLELK